MHGRLRLYLTLGVIAVAILTFPLVAQERSAPGAAAPKPPAAVPEGTLYRPLATPDRIILTWDGDPARSQAVSWRTAPGVDRSVAQLARAEPGPGFARAAVTVSATTTPLTTDLGAALYHTARFTGLQPATRYAYRVGDGTNWSEWFQFRTASAQPEPFTFIYFGDAQNDLKSLWSRVIREAYSDAPRASFMIHAGDLVNRANRDAEWGEWFYAGGWVYGMVPSIPTPGNHEYEGPVLKRELSRHWRPQFALPENGPARLHETAYYLDYQGVRFVSLNSNERQQEQAGWLAEVLRDNPNRWTVATFHHPLYSSARGRDNKNLREMWQPVLEANGVDLVLQGHDHTYARSNIATGASASSSSGTVYVVSVSGPKMYGVDREPWMARAAEDTQLYQIISIDGDLLRYQARTADGELYDAFDLRKRDGLPNRLIERRAGRIPERLRPPVRTDTVSTGSGTRSPAPAGN